MLGRGLVVPTRKVMGVAPTILADNPRMPILYALERSPGLGSPTRRETSGTKGVPKNATRG